MCGAEQGAVRDYWRNIMHEKIEVLGISVEKCYVEDVMECVNENWFKEALSTYGVINMKLLMAAQEDEKLKKYISILDKAVVDEPEVLKAAGWRTKDLRRRLQGTVSFPRCSGFYPIIRTRCFSSARQRRIRRPSVILWRKSIRIL